MCAHTYQEKQYFNCFTLFLPCCAHLLSRGGDLVCCEFMMAKHRYLPSVVLFDGEEEHEIDENNTNKFRSRIPHRLPKTNNKKENSAKLDLQTQLKIQNIQKRTIESTTRSLNILQETGEIGFIAARELVSQGEQLQKTNASIDEIDCHLKDSQKELHGIKSVIHGLKNIITRSSRSPSPCKHNISPNKKSPKSGKSTFYGSDFLSIERESCTLVHNVHVKLEPCSSQQVDDILEANLEAMANHLDQFKELGVFMGQELDRQNVLIDIIQNKVEQTDINIGQQNKDMNKILGK